MRYCYDYDRIVEVRKTENIVSSLEYVNVDSVLVEQVSLPEGVYVTKSSRRYDTDSTVLEFVHGVGDVIDMSVVCA